MNKIDINENQTEQNPIKWRKHLLLVEWKLRDAAKLSESIHRYKISDYRLCLSSIKEKIQQNSNGKVYIIKLVPRFEYYHLPNLLIDSEEKLKEAYVALNRMGLMSYSEIWYCCNKVENYNTVFGRMIIDNDDLYPRICPIYIELVWGKSTRDIDSYPHTNCSYIAIQKANWNASPIVKELIVVDMEKKDIMTASMCIIRQIAIFYREIKDFGLYVFSKGCRRLSLEFSYCDGELNFIDWDSDDDDKVLF